MALTLVVLAAGLGSRYGGLKQMDPVGPNGETILDFSVFDALRAGFDRVVFVIRRDFATAFQEQIAAKYRGRIAVEFVYQSLDLLPSGFAVPPGREKPWGTGHATWCAREVIKEPFAVVNADDFYGADAFRSLAAFLTRAASNEGAMVGFHLHNTLSEAGAVSRGICEVDPLGRLLSIVERTGIRGDQVGPGRSYAANTLVSMNCWGFTGAIFEGLNEEFAGFLTHGLTPAPTTAEFYLPAAVSHLIARGKLLVEVLPTASSWFGVTYREDRSRVQASLETLVSAGLYPKKLWER
jgi:UTP-glucose-1-phosphate uridylyltransferase